MGVIKHRDMEISKKSTRVVPIFSLSTGCRSEWWFA